MECQSLFGDVYIIKDENEIAAVYGIMYDGDRAEIVQYCIQLPDQSIRCYMEFARVIFLYFLRLNCLEHIQIIR